MSARLVTKAGHQARLLCSSSAADAGGARGQILDAALQHVGTLGWSREALAAGAVDAGLPSVSHGIVTGGEAELVHHFMQRANEKGQDEMRQQLGSMEALSPARRVGVGVRARLSQNAPFVANGTWPQAMALGALPNNALRTARLLAAMSSNVWVTAHQSAAPEGGSEHEGASAAAGDHGATAAVTGVYVAAELFMLSDNSPDLQDTWRFLDERIDELESWEVQGMPTPSVQHLQDVAFAVATGGLAIASALPSIFGQPPSARR